MGFFNKKPKEESKDAVPTPPPELAAEPKPTQNLVASEALVCQLLLELNGAVQELNNTIDRYGKLCIEHQDKVLLELQKLNAEVKHA